MPIRFQFEPAVQFFQPFVHSSQAHARFPIYLSQGSQTLGSYPTSEIPNFEDGVFTLRKKRTLARLAFECRWTFVKLSCNIRNRAVSIAMGRR